MFADALWYRNGTSQLSPGELMCQSTPDNLRTLFFLVSRSIATIELHHLVFARGIKSAKIDEVCMYQGSCDMVFQNTSSTPCQPSTNLLPGT